MKNPKYTSIFSSVIRPMVSEEKDEHLALASAIDVSRFVPNIDIDKNILKAIRHIQYGES